ncbi:MAG: hypothetical protein U0163_08085 [Gemmatimonadaceae bacterium]
MSRAGISGRHFRLTGVENSGTANGPIESMACADEEVWKRAEQ